MPRARTVALIAALSAIGGCSRAPTPAEIAARAVTLRPADARLASLYEHSCRACHAESRALAPLAGDRAAWRPRLAKGMPALMQSIVAGFNGMPAGGQCFACTPQDYEALVRFMADEAGQ